MKRKEQRYGIGFYGMWFSLVLLLLLFACSPAEPLPIEAVIQFSADRTTIPLGECAKMTWSVSGGFGIELNGEKVSKEGETQVCPLVTTTYTLSVDAGDHLEEKSIEIRVSEEGVTPPVLTEIPAQTQTGNSQVTVERDLHYGSYTQAGQEQSLKLDLYLPASTARVPVLIFIHGGGWIEGSKDNCPGNDFAKYGYAVACVDYRLAPIQGGCPAEMVFPVQIQDVKAAVRWLRTNADQYGLDANKIGAFGDSSGGHLASLLGTSTGESALQGDQNLGVSDAVQAVADWYGPVDVTQAPPQIVFMDDPCSSSLGALSDKYGGEATPYFYWTFAWSAFLGGSLGDANVLQKAKSASPLTYIDVSDPPFLILHGEKDGMIPVEQSALLASALQNAGVEVTFIRLPEAGHGFCDPNGSCPEVYPEFLEPTLLFFTEHLK